MKTCSICGLKEPEVQFPSKGSQCRSCKAKKLRDRKNTDPNYYAKRKAYRDKNKTRINQQKKQSYDRNNTHIKKTNNAYYHNNAERCKTRQRQYQARVESVDVKSWLAKCMKHTRFADRRLNREFDLSLQFLLDLYEKQNGLCAISGVAMTHNRNDLFAISIDRINNSHGHLRSNVQLVCQAMNLAKREYKNSDIHAFMLATHEVAEKVSVQDFDGYSYPESTANYSMIAKDRVIQKLRVLCSSEFLPPYYEVDLLIDDMNRVKDELTSNYVYDGFLRSHYPDSRGFAGKKLIRHFHPHSWAVRTQNKPLIQEVWGNGAIFEKALINLVDGTTKISFDRIIRELLFAGAGIPSQIHPGFAKMVYETYCAGKIVYDPFAGWGGRMLAAWSLGLEYIGNELSLPTHDGLVGMSKFIGYDCCLNHIDSLNCNRVNADFMFTSPPFGSEAYIESQTNCDLDKLLELTNHIKVRVLHVNAGLLERLEPTEIVPIMARTKMGGQVSKEFLAIYRS
jgi:hypothetical protein